MMELLIKLLIVLACSVLWSLGGSTFPKIKGDSLYRKIGIPIVLGLYVALTFAPFWIGVLYGLAVMGLLTVSYGLNDLTHTITGYIFKLIGYPNSQVDSGNCRPCEIATRALAGFLWSLASIVLAVAGIMPVWCLYTLICTVGIGLAGGLIRKPVISELVTGGIVGSIVLFL